MELKEKLQVTENKINKVRDELRSIERCLESIKHHKETNKLISKDQITKVTELEDMLLDIEMKLNEYLVFNIE